MENHLSDTMKAVHIGDDDARTLSWREAELPSLRAGEVLIEVAATAINRADLLQRMGRYPPPKGVTEVMGLEAAGRVVALGPEVEGGIAVGDEVCCLLAGGGYGRYVACPREQLLPRPATLSLQEAAALPEAIFTAYLNLYMLGELGEGEHALVHAGASGIGTAAIQICRALGNPVHITASAGKLAACAALGATTTIDRQSGDFVAEVREATEGKGVSTILDPVGGSYLGGNIDALAVGGRLVVIGLLGGIKGELPLAKLLTRRLQVIGSVLRARPVAEKRAIRDAIAERVWPKVEAGEIAPVIDRSMPIEEVNEAHELMRNNATVGKIVLTME